jgi:hypothetical protein
MKRNDLIRHLNKHNCKLRRVGGNLSIYQNISSKKQTAIPRHHELSDLQQNLQAA